MRNEPFYQPITVDEFLKIDFPADRKYELVDGVIRMMTGGSPAHARVAYNIAAYLRPNLRGTACRAYGSDMGVRIGDTDARYPDVTIYCGNPTSIDAEKRPLFTDPVVIFEILSPSTSKTDQNEKLGECREIESLQTVVFVDPDDEVTRVIQRLGPTSWRDDLFAQPHDVELPTLNLTIPHAEIFARD